MRLSFSIEDLRVEREGVLVLEGFNFASWAPGWIGIVGANGSGKTTLLRALAGRLPVQGGRILLGSDDLTWDRGARADRIGFAVDAAMLPADLSPREIYGLSARTRCAIDEPVLAPLRRALDIESFLDQRCGALSAGMGQRVALLGAFLDLPAIVVLDEPFNWLDPLTAFDVKSALRALVAEQGLTLITALHDVTTLTAYCDRGLLMSSGQVAMEMDEASLRAGLADLVAFETAMISRLRAAR
ncbi:MAG TPA: ABC transporter ATP-binding protein [Allosphingosinicella sp.]|jgi:ABC-type multidrug transport system ATPase subunit